MAVLSRVRSYVPKIGGNDKLDEDSRMVVRLKSIDVYQKQVQLRKFTSMTAEQLTAQMMSQGGSDEIKSILFKNVVGFRNLLIEDEKAESENGYKEATIQDVWDMGEFELCMELFNEILGSTQLKKEEAKNLESQSGSIPLLEGEVAH